MRSTVIKRETRETQIELELNLDGTGKFESDLNLGFLNHMLTALVKNSLFDLRLKASGDLEVDDHHLTEDIAIVLGSALRETLGEKRGVRRYGSIMLPMDEVLCACAVDLSGRGCFETNYAPVREKVGDFSTELMREFFGSLAANCGMSLQIQYIVAGCNEHHRLEVAFKGVGRALREAVEIDSRVADLIPSTKGTI